MRRFPAAAAAALLAALALLPGSARGEARAEGF
jgi:hypothetical protein